MRNAMETWLFLAYKRDDFRAAPTPALQHLERLGYIRRDPNTGGAATLWHITPFGIQALKDPYP